MNDFAADLHALIELYRQREDITDDEILEILDAAVESLEDED